MTMALFKRRATDPAEMERLRAELHAMGARLDAADAAKNELGTHVEQLAAKVDETAEAPTEVDGPALAELRRRLDQLDGRIEADRRADTSVDDEAFSELLARVDEIGARFQAPLAAPPPPPPPPDGGLPDPRPVDDAFLDEVRRHLDALDERLDTLDLRITSISTELANQIDEIGADLETSGGTPHADQIVDELRDAQTRLANEQARYQIAFRQDLADLAERLKRS